MDFSQRDFAETHLVADYIKRIDAMDAKYVDVASDEIFLKQPFFLSVLLGYRFDVSSLELEEIMKIYFMIWEYFKSSPGVQTTQVSEDFFERIQAKTIKLLSYLEVETSQQKKERIISADLSSFRSKALITAVLFLYQSRPVLLQMKENVRAIVLINIRSFIECFESL